MTAANAMREVNWVRTNPPNAAKRYVLQLPALRQNFPSIWAHDATIETGGDLLCLRQTEQAKLLARKEVGYVLAG